MGLTSRRWFLTSWLLVASTTSAVLLPTTIACAEEKGRKEEAQSRFKRGIELYEERDFNSALIEFRKAYDLYPNYQILYNIGQTLFQLLDYAGALKAFDSYLFEGGSAISAARKTEVDGEITKLKNRVGRLEITTNVEGAEITIDDVSVGKTPFPKPLLVSAGKRKVVASKEGRASVTRMVDVAGNSDPKLNLELLELRGETRFVDSPSKFTKWSWIGLSVAGALGVGAAITGTLALSSSKDLEDKRFVGRDPNDDVKSLQDKTRRLAVTTDVLAGAAILTLGMTIVLTLSHNPSPTKTDKSASTAPTFAVGVSPFGANFYGSF